MLKQQLEILSLFEDCTREINTLEIYKTIEPKYYDVLDKLIKEGYLEYKKDNYLKMTGFGLSKFENPEKHQLKLKNLTKEDLRYLFSKVKYVQVSLLELSFGKELINSLRVESEFIFKKYKLENGGKIFSFEGIFEAIGSYKLSAIPSESNIDYEFVSFWQHPLTINSSNNLIEPVKEIKELSDKIIIISKEASDELEQEKQFGIGVLSLLSIMFSIISFLIGNFIFSTLGIVFGLVEPKKSFASYLGIIIGVVSFINDVLIFAS
jgi:hypothetical protein